MVNLMQDQLKVLKETSSASGSAPVNMETPDPYNQLPSACPQTCSFQHLLKNGNDTPYLLPLARSAPPLRISLVT